MSNVRSFVQRVGSSLGLAAVIALLAVTQTAARSGAVASAMPESGSALMMSSIEPVAEPPADTPTSVTFHYLGTACGMATFTFKVNGVTGATFTDSTCDCNQTIKSQTIDLTLPANAALQAALALPTCSLITASGSTPWGVAELDASVVRSVSGTQLTCLLDRTGHNCVGTTTNVCSPSSNIPGLFSFSNSLNPSTCSTSDFDNDGVLNSADNCPSTPNATQADSDNNGTGDACQTVVTTVPWSGNRAKPHVVYSGGSLVLQAVASKGGDGVAIPLSSGSWDFGDGSAIQTINVSNSLVLEATHTYSGAVNTPYTATITVKDTNNVTYTDTVKVQIQTNSLDTKVNMAIDRALWFNHKSMQRGGALTGSLATCSSTNMAACTSGMIQAFEVNGHRETGDPMKDPYANDVARGLRWLQGNLRRLSISAQTGGNPDSNSNGYGLEDPSGHVVYIGGQIVDAFVASGTPNATATTGTEAGRTYHDIVQDLMDAYQYGQNENNQGGWVYDWNSQDGIDSSSSGWWGVGVAAAKVWGIQPAGWVQNLNLTYGIPSLQFFNGTNAGSDGACSYRARNTGYGDGGTADTAACMIMLAADNQPRSSARFTAAEKNLRREFPGSSPNNMYAMYNVTKAMRLAVDSTGAAAPITLMDGSKDWYNDPTNGFATTLVNRQGADGSWNSDSWVDGNLSTSWGILILSPALFEQGPTAVCSVDATTVCQAGAPGGCNTTGTNPYATVHFDGSQSTAGDNPIAANGYSWNFDDGGTTTDANGVTAQTSYSTIGTKNATLTVTDTKGNNSSVTCPVAVTSAALPPIVDAGGPYSICIGDPVILTSTSVGRGSNIVSYEWDFKGAINFAAIDATGASTNQTTYFTSLGVGTYDIGLRIKDDNQPVNTEIAFSTVTIRDCTPPVITVPANITLITNGTSAAATYTVTATDNVDPTVPVSCASSPTAGLSSGSQFPLGTTTLTCNATDVAGNHAAPQTFTVTVIKNLPPVVTAPANQVLEATSPGGAVATFSATVTDDRDTLTATCTPASGSTFGINVNTSKTTTVTCSATDSGGLTGSAQFTVTVQDTTKPVITVPANQTIHATSLAGANFNFTPTASDIVDVTDPVNCNRGSGNFPFGPTTVTCSSTDKHNNTQTASFTVTVTNTPPTATPFFVSTHGEPVTIPLLTHASDTDGDALTLLGACGGMPPALGFCNVNTGTGTVTFNPNPQWFGPQFQFGYTVIDNRTGSASSFVQVTYLNKLPIPGHPSFSTPVNTPLFLDEQMLLAGGTDLDGDQLSIPEGVAAQHGTITHVEGEDHGIYTPNTGFIGVDTLTYQVDDDHGGLVNTTATVTVTAPTTTTISAPAVTYGANGIITVTVSSGASSAPTGTLSLSIAGGPAQTATLVNGSATFTMNMPNAGDYALNASYTGQGFFLPSVGTGSLHVDKATSTTTVSCPVSLVYTGSDLTPCTAYVTGVNLDADVTPVTYMSNRNFGTATAKAVYDGDDNHTGSAGGSTFEITKAPTTTVVTCEPTTVYNGSAQELCTAKVTGADLSQTLAVTYDHNTNVGTANASASYAGDDNHTGSDGSATFAITKAPTTTVVTCSPVTTVYTGSAQELCTASVSGAGGFSSVLPVTYDHNTNVGTATGSASYAGDDNYSGSDSSATFEITKAPTTTVVTCNPTTTVYTGAAKELCTASVSGAGDFSSVLPVTYDHNTNAGTATGSASYAGDDNHTGSDSSATFEITKATTTTVVTCNPTTTVYNGFAQELCTANVTGDGGLNQALTVSYAGSNTNVGTATGSATYAGDDNHTGSSSSATFEITKAAPACSVTPYSVTYDAAAHTATGSCLGVRGESLAGLDLTGTTHTGAGTYTDAWTFTDVTGNYSNTGGSVTDAIAKSPTKTTLAINTDLALAGAPVTLTATVVSVAPGAGIPNGTVTFFDGTTSLGPGTLNASGVATLTSTTLANGPHTFTAVYNESPNFLASAVSNPVSTLIYGFAAGGGTFVISDTNATSIGNAVNFWGAQWEKTNVPTGGKSNASFKGFAMTPLVPTVGATFTSAPGNSVPQPSSVPQYIGIIVTSKVTKSGSNITGTIVKLVVVKVDAGYVADPGHAGTGTIVRFVQ